MKFLYVDESGDPGISANSPSRYFILAGLALDVTHYQALIADLHLLRHNLAAKYGILPSEEIHASAFISSPGPLKRISLNNRLRIMLDCLNWCGLRSDLQLFTVCYDKHSAVTDTIFQDAWQQLLLLFDQHLASKQTQGLVFCDNTDGLKLTNLMRAMQRPVPTPGVAAVPALHHLIGDPTLWDSRTSFLHQLVDVAAYFAKQLLEPNQHIRNKGAQNYFRRLDKINALINQQPSGMLLL